MSSGYRPPSSEPRGTWARAIHRRRRELGLSQQAAFEVLGKRLGFSPKSRAAYVALDMGVRQPTEAEAAILAEWLGGYPAPDMERSGRDDTPPDLSALLDKMSAQTDAINRLIDRLDSLASAAIRDGVADALREVGLYPDDGASRAELPPGPQG